MFGGLGKTALGIVLSPLLGFVLAQLIVVIVLWANLQVDAVRRRPALPRAAARLGGVSIRSATAATTRRRRWASSPCCSIRKGMLGGAFHVPFWVVISCQLAMALGTLMGGWRIVHTMGSRITHLKPIQGFCAETGGAITLFLATALGVPVSTTHTITGAIIGVGAARRTAAVRWHIAQRIVVAWVVTLPAAALIERARLPRHEPLRLGVEAIRRVSAASIACSREPHLHLRAA